MAGENDEDGGAGVETGAEGAQTGGENGTNTPPAGDGAGPDGGNTGESGSTDGVPETYELNLGEGVQLSDDQVAAYSDLFKEWGLTQDQVSALGELEADLGSQMQEQAAEELTAVMDGWLEEAKNDPDIGGDNWEKTMANAKVAMAELGSDDFVELLDNTGLGSHPALIKAFSMLGATMGDDTFQPGGASGETVDAASSWYGETTPSSKKG